MQTFEEFLKKVSTLKKVYKTGSLKISAPAVYNLIMAGAFDSMISNGEVSLGMRFEAIEMFKKASGSKAQLPKSKTGSLGMDEIKEEFDRRLWLSGTNPLYSFRVCDFYSEALKSIGFNSTGTRHLRYRKEKTDFSAPVDIFGSFQSLFLPKTMRIYGNKNMPRRPAIVGIYRGYETKTWGNGNQFRNIKISDGGTEGEATMWPAYGTTEFDKNIENSLKMNRGKACLFIGKLSTSKRGYKSFTLQSVVPFS